MIDHWVLVFGIIVLCVSFPKREATANELFKMAFWAAGILFLQICWGLLLNIGSLSDIALLAVEHKIRVGVALCYGFILGQFITGLIKQEKSRRATINSNNQNHKS
jgi:hypothetical protein